MPLDRCDLENAGASETALALFDAAAPEGSLATNAEERELLAALEKKSTEVQGLMESLRSLRFVHGETSEALEGVLTALGVDSVADAHTRIAGLRALERMAPRR